MEKENLDLLTKPLIINSASNSIDLEWRSFTVEITQKNKTKRILNDASGYVKHGQFLSIMGPSGLYKKCIGQINFMDKIVKRSWKDNFTKYVSRKNKENKGCQSNWSSKFFSIQL